jgi:hypothetical protein
VKDDRTPVESMAVRGMSLHSALWNTQFAVEYLASCESAAGGDGRSTGSIVSQLSPQISFLAIPSSLRCHSLAKTVVVTVI